MRIKRRSYRMREERARNRGQGSSVGCLSSIGFRWSVLPGGSNRPNPILDSVRSLQRFLSARRSVLSMGIPTVVDRPARAAGHSPQMSIQQSFSVLLWTRRERFLHRMLWNLQVGRPVMRNKRTVSRKMSYPRYGSSSTRVAYCWRAMSDRGFSRNSLDSILASYAASMASCI